MAKGKAPSAKGGRGKRAAPGQPNGWLKVCPNCGYAPKAAHFENKVPARIRCPICFYHGPAIEVRAAHYREMKFAHERLPERDEGRLVLPEILLMLILSAVAVLFLWKFLRALG